MFKVQDSGLKAVLDLTAETGAKTSNVSVRTSASGWQMMHLTASLEGSGGDPPNPPQKQSIEALFI